jgi:hypothetical protein
MKVEETVSVQEMASPVLPDDRRARGWSTIEPLEECRAALHKRAFRLVHDLAGHPLFAIEALVDMAKAAAERKGDLYYDAGEVSLTDKWGNIPVPQMPAAEVIRRIETAGAWMIMKHVEVDPRYKAVLDEWAEFVRRLAGPEEARFLRNPEMLVMITSPNRVTPYHFDAEVNFLVQIHGEKDLWVCDPLDRTITLETEIERYYAVSINSGNYKPHADDKAAEFHLSPGDAVHIPSHGAHWVRNRNNVSVSLSLNFEFPKWKFRDVYHVNHYLRRIGLSPRPPGSSVVSDRTKAAVMATLRSVPGGGFVAEKAKGAASSVRRFFRRKNRSTH